jgi:hypothetical protein
MFPAATLAAPVSIIRSALLSAMATTARAHPAHDLRERCYEGLDAEGKWMEEAQALQEWKELIDLMPPMENPEHITEWKATLARLFVPFGLVPQEQPDFTSKALFLLELADILQTKKTPRGLDLLPSVLAYIQGRFEEQYQTEIERRSPSGRDRRDLMTRALEGKKEFLVKLEKKRQESCFRSMMSKDLWSGLCNAFNFMERLDKLFTAGDQGLNYEQTTCLMDALNEWDKSERLNWGHIQVLRKQGVVPHDLTKTILVKRAVQAHEMIYQTKRIIDTQGTATGLSRWNTIGLRRLLSKFRVSHGQLLEKYVGALTKLKGLLEEDVKTNIDDWEQRLTEAKSSMHDSTEAASWADIAKLNALYVAPSASQQPKIPPAESIAAASPPLILEARAEKVVQETTEVLGAAERLETQTAQEAQSKKRKLKQEAKNVEQNLEETRASCKRVRTLLRGKES